jgi:hypothetical protein
LRQKNGDYLVLFDFDAGSRAVRDPDGGAARLKKKKKKKKKKL